MQQKLNNNETIVHLLVWLQEICVYFWRKKFIIIFIGILVSSMGVAYTFMSRQQYAATLTFVNESSSESGVSAYSSIAAQFGVDLNSGVSAAFEGDNLAEIFRSRSLIEKTLLTHDNSMPNNIIEEYLATCKIKYDKLKVNWSKKNRYTDSLLNSVYKRIIDTELFIYKKDKKLDINTIEFVSYNEVLAKIFVENLTKNTIDYYTAYKTTKSNKNIDILQKQADSLDKIISGRMYGLAETNDLNINPLKQSARVNAQRKNFDVTVATAVYTEVMKQLELAKITNRKETPLIQIIDKPILPLIKLKPGKLKMAIVFFAVGVIAAMFFLILKKTYERIAIQESKVYL